jgi:SAM-dependent methyltransferase
MITNIFLLIFGIILLGALIFSVWMLWGFFHYGAPLVSTSKKTAQKMVELAAIHPGKTIYDLGCGVGAILFEVAKNSSGDVKCFGYDLVRPAIWFARIKNFFLKKNIQFYSQDFFTANLSDADVIFCYLFPKVIDKIYTEKWAELPTGCRIISHGFPFTSLQPTHVVQVGKDKIYVYEK